MGILGFGEGDDWDIVEYKSPLKKKVSGPVLQKLVYEKEAIQKSRMILVSGILGFIDV